MDINIPIGSWFWLKRHTEYVRRTFLVDRPSVKVHLEDYLWGVDFIVGRWEMRFSWFSRECLAD